jgi:two-component system CheB/CheR fusion protein
MAVALKEGPPIRGAEAVAERPDGKRVPFLAYPTPLRDRSGALTGAVNTLIDITERKRSEEFEKPLVTIVESSDDAIVRKDLDGIIKTWNPGAVRLFGYTADEVIGKPITLLIPMDRHDEESDILLRIRRGECIDPYETVRRRKDGSLVEVSITVSPVGSDRKNKRAP